MTRFLVTPNGDVIDVDALLARIERDECIEYVSDCLPDRLIPAPDGLPIAAWGYA